MENQNTLTDFSLKDFIDLNYHHYLKLGFGLDYVTEAFVKNHGPKDFEIAQKAIAAYKSRAKKRKFPAMGDYIKLSTQSNANRDYCIGGIENKSENKSEAYVCESVYNDFPWIFLRQESYRVLVSGGTWKLVPIEKLKLIGKKRKIFRTWNCTELKTNGTIYFPINTLYWELQL